MGGEVIFIGIDPGKKGAIVQIVAGHDGDSRVERMEPMPIVSATTGRGKDEYDIGGIDRLFRELVPMTQTGNAFVVVEKPQPLPPIRTSDGFQLGGSIGNFNRGLQFGFAWMLEALRIPYQLVAPRTWQRVMHEGTPGEDTKQRSILAAQRLFPGVDLRRSPRARKADDGFADALLLAEYARRTKNGGSRNG